MTSVILASCICTRVISVHLASACLVCVPNTKLSNPCSRYKPPPAVPGADT